jgi:hypothetical protein
MLVSDWHPLTTPGDTGFVCNLDNIDCIVTLPRAPFACKTMSIRVATSRPKVLPPSLTLKKHHSVTRYLPNLYLYAMRSLQPQETSWLPFHT